MSGLQKRNENEKKNEDAGSLSAQDQVQKIEVNDAAEKYAAQKIVIRERAMGIENYCKRMRSDYRRYVKVLQKKIQRLKSEMAKKDEEIDSLLNGAPKNEENGAQAAERPDNFFLEELRKKSAEVAQLTKELADKSAEAYNANLELKAHQKNADATQKKHESEIKKLNDQLQKVGGKLQELKYETSNNVVLINIQRAALIKKDEEIKNEREAHQMALQNLQDQLDEANKLIAANAAAHEKTVGELHAQLTEERDQSKELRECNKEQESQLETVREELEKLTCDADTLEAKIEGKDAEIANLKKKVEATKKEWEEKMETAEKDHELEVKVYLQSIDRLEKEIETTNEEWKEKMEDTKKAHQLETKGHLEKPSMDYNTHVEKMVDDFEKEIKEANERKVQANAEPRNEEPSRKKRKCQE
ncbi:hypothetical protein CAEBREN_26026 [Caenorhabditis brenneri]|uniref:Uncharacterized protein n=1 Tax=Caenorhabditis brenneri TaxID=135651 RepID=G0MMP7_CAEBE|nr:hypothetical protein CAEBREN_26026 [Caenorhabditis brenneri]